MKMFAMVVGMIQNMFSIRGNGLGAQIIKILNARSI